MTVNAYSHSRIARHSRDEGESVHLAPILLVSLFCWVQLFNRLRGFWTFNEQYAYGWFVPFLAGALFWRQCKDDPTRCGTLETLTPGSKSRTNHSLWLIVILLALLLPFRLLEEANPGWIALLWIHALVLCAGCLCALRFCGGTLALSHYWFPVFFLLTCIPWPSRIDALVTNGLREQVARITVEVVGLLNIPAVQQGNLIQIATTTIGIDEACSGIRSLQTSIMLSLLLGELFRLPTGKRLLLMGFGIPVAFIMNVVRTSFLTWSAARQGFERVNAWHASVGVAEVAIVCGSLILLAFISAKTAPPRAARNLLEMNIAEGSTGPHWQDGTIPPPCGIFRLSAFSFSLALGCCCVALTEELTWAWYHWPGKGVMAANTWSIRWPTNEVSFEEKTLPQRTLSMLHCNKYKSASWIDPQGNNWSIILLEWPATRAVEAYVGGHNPEQCITGVGRSFVKQVEPVAVRTGNFSTQFTHRVFDQQNQPFHVFQGTWEPFVPPTSQRLFGDNTLKGRLKNVLERRLIRGGITFEVVLTGPATEQEAKGLLQEGFASLIFSPTKSQTVVEPRL